MTVDNDYVRDSWEWAVSRIIVAHELDMHTSNKTMFRDLYRASMWPVMARKAWTEYNQSAEVPLQAHDLIRLLAKKQHDYGHANIMEHGQHGVAIRLWDKIARYDNLLRRGVDPENESLLDTLMDIIGYCVIWLMLANNTFVLPLAADMPRGRGRG